MNTATENTLTFERVIDAPRTLVWQAWTDPKHASQWWGPNGCTVPLFEADRRPGGRFRIDVKFGDSMTRIEGVYEEVVELERVVTYGSLACDGIRLFDSRRAVTFEDVGGKTKVTLVQTFYNMAPEGTAAMANTQAGMKQHFDRLEEHLRRQ